MKIRLRTQKEKFFIGSVIILVIAGLSVVLAIFYSILK
jgi:hypothetical protein